MDTEKYENKMEYPTKVRKPLLPKIHNSETVKEYAQKLQVYEEEYAAYQVILAEYRNETNRLWNEFKKDAIDDVGLLNHPKADKAYNMAYERGHSEGLYSIYDELCEIADLLID